MTEISIVIEEIKNGFIVRDSFDSDVFKKTVDEAIKEANKKLNYWRKNCTNL